jgi:hypothetical protein
MDETYPSHHIKNYMKICKKNNFELIKTISLDIKSLKPIDSIILSSGVSKDQVEAINFIMNSPLSGEFGDITDESDKLEYIYEKYQSLRGGAKDNEKGKGKGKGKMAAAKAFGVFKTIAKNTANAAKPLAKEIARGAIETAVTSTTEALGGQSLGKIIDQVKSVITKELPYMIHAELMNQIELKIIPRVKEMISAEILKIKSSQSGGYDLEQSTVPRDMKEMSFNVEDSDISSENSEKKCECAKK